MITRLVLFFYTHIFNIILIFFHIFNQLNIDINLLTNFPFVAFLQKKIGKESRGMCFLIIHIYILHFQTISALIDIVELGSERCNVNFAIYILFNLVFQSFKLFL